MRKRSVKRRRRFSKRRGKYDKGYKAICRFGCDLVCDVLNTNASLGIHWGSSGTSGMHDIYIDDCPEFSALTGLWSYWQLNGLKVKVTPVMNVTGVSGSGTYQLTWASFTGN